MEVSNGDIIAVGVNPSEVIISRMKATLCTKKFSATICGSNWTFIPESVSQKVRAGNLSYSLTLKKKLC